MAQVGLGAGPNVPPMGNPLAEQVDGSTLSRVELAVIAAACVSVHAAVLPGPLARAVPLLIVLPALAVWAIPRACGAPGARQFDRPALIAAVWLVWCAVCVLAAGDRHLAVHRVIGHGVAACAWFVAGRSSQTAAKQIASLLALSGAAAAALGLALWALGVTPGQFCYTLRDQNTLGAHLALVTPLAVWRAWRDGPRRWLHRAAALLCLGGTLATGSRGAVLAITLAAASAWALVGGTAPPDRLARLRSVLAALAVLLVPALALAAVSDPAQSSSMPHRLFMWATCARIAQESPAFGAGPGNFQLAYLSHRPPDSRESYALAIPADAHNDAMDALAETGVPGLILAIALVGTCLMPAIRRSALEGRGLAVAVSAALIGWCANGLLNSSLANPATEPACLLVLGLAVSASSERRPWAVPRPLAWFAPFLVLLPLSLAGQRVIRTVWAWSVVSQIGLASEQRAILREGGEPPLSRGSAGPGAAAALRRAIRIDPAYNALWQLLAAVTAASEPGVARAALLRSIELVPSYAGSHHALGLLLAAEGHAVRAREELRTAVRLDPYNPDYRIDLAEQLGPDQRFAALRNLARAAQLLLMTQEVVTARFGPASREAEAVNEGFERVNRVRRQVMGGR